MCLTEASLRAEGRHTLADEQIAQPLENVLARQLLGNVDR